MTVDTAHRPFAIGICVGVVITLGSLAFSQARHAIIRVKRQRSVHNWNTQVGRPDDDEFTPIELRRSGTVVDGISGAIGNTPLIRIASLSELTGCEILVR